MYETDEEWIANFIRVEYGQDIKTATSVKASDIKLLGEFIINDVVTDYFSYPHTGEPSWIIIEVIDDKEDCISITNTPPPL